MCNYGLKFIVTFSVIGNTVWSDMSADAERFVSFQKSADPNRFSELSADAERFCERQNKQPIQIGFVSGVCRLMLRGFVSAKTIS